MSLTWFEQDSVKAASFVVFKVANFALFVIAKDPIFSILSSFINFVVFRIL